MTQPLQSALQQAIRSALGCANDFNGDLHTMCQFYDVPEVPISGRLIAVAQKFDPSITDASSALNYFLQNPQNACGNLALDFVNSTTLDPRITFTRASSATYFDQNGVLQTASNDVARFDYNPSTLAAQGLLIEEQRTNLCLQSENFGTTWSPSGTTVTTNIVVSPDGTINADNILEIASSNEHRIRQTFTGLTANTVHTVSVFVKNLGGRNLRIRVLDTDNVANGYYITVSPSLGTVVQSATTVGAGSDAAGSITAVGNGWYRVTLSGNAGATCTKYTLDFFSIDGTTVSFLGDVSKGITLWGAMLEQGAFSTSYVKTTSASATRNADVASMTGTNFSDWYNAAEGTLYAESLCIQPSSVFINVAGVFTPSNQIVLQLGRNGADSRGFGQAASINQGSGTFPANSFVKQILAGKVNDFALSTNGSAVATDTSTDPMLPTSNFFGIGIGPTGGSIFNGTIRKLAYYPTRLSNEQLQALTG